MKKCLSMLKKEAKQRCPSKARPAYNLPASQCITGQKLVKVTGSTCAGCYALKGRYRFGNVQKALKRRLAALQDPRWVSGMIELIKGRPVFRWHDSGDIQSAQHLINIFEVCKQTPETKHWLPTREAQFLKFLDPDVVPKNLKIVFSDHMNDQARGVTFWPYTSGVSTKGGVTCPAPKQGNQCQSCRACWDRNVKRVIYGKH